MVSILLKEEGDYICLETGEERNMLVANIAYTPEGTNVGWDEVIDEEDAMKLYNIKRKEIIVEP